MRLLGKMSDCVGKTAFGKGSSLKEIMFLRHIKNCGVICNNTQEVCFPSHVDVTYGIIVSANSLNVVFVIEKNSKVEAINKEQRFSMECKCPAIRWQA